MTAPLAFHRRKSIMLDQSNVMIDVHLNAQDPAAIKEEIRAGLCSTPRTLPTKYLYDDRGSALFEQICESPEYYQTRTERALLQTVADEVIAQTGTDTLVELGSGAATKTRVLLDAMARANHLRAYVPFDFSEGIVRRVAHELAEEYDGLEVHGVVGDFLTHLDHLPEGDARFVIFLGGTIGNMGPDAASAFLCSVHHAMDAGDFFLLGAQLITDVARMEAAYNDSAGLTAAFNKNVLAVVNSVIGSDFDPDAFVHVARFNHDERWIEMSLRSLREQVIPLPDLAVTLPLQAGEALLTEISCKYTRGQVEGLLTAAGFHPVAWYSDPHQLHGLALVQKP